MSFGAASAANDDDDEDDDDGVFSNWSKNAKTCN